ncbi:PREDICTED: pituitary tumor-transforming gene 1 protein-interacting protein-like, partial [Tauraco erythrolophus]|uniref:pituitary tumor-transforming gene 1 protein-interacting protein-like n=1 Tax=Tauraco erythrolophus TaxID=121530 RepID=UPI0005237295
CSEFSRRSCEECLKNVSCLWCYTNNTCIDYPVRSILPPSSLCSLSNARWGVCWINFEALIIAIAVVAGLILVSLAVCCCYCCYCRRRSRSRPDEEEERLARKREERRLESLQRYEAMEVEDLSMNDVVDSPSRTDVLPESERPNPCIMTTSTRKRRLVIVVDDSLLRGTEGSICRADSPLREVCCLPGARVEDIARKFLSL